MLTNCKLPIAIATAILLAGCDSGNAPESAKEATDSETIVISGRAADGYLVDAKVCADLNASNRCDESEPSTTTGEGGKFMLALTPEEANANIVVEAIAGETVDEDSNEPVKSDFRLKAPIDMSRDEQFVSPITTMVLDVMEQNDLSLEQAVEQVSKDLQTSADPLQNYITAKSSGNEEDAQAAERLHRIAQLRASISGVLDAYVRNSGTALEEVDASVSNILSMMTPQLLEVADASLDSEIPSDAFHADAVVHAMLGTFGATPAQPVPAEEDSAQPE